MVARRTSGSRELMSVGAKPQRRLSEFFQIQAKNSKDTLKKAENATVGMSKLLNFPDLESAALNSSDGVSRFRRSWLEVGVAVLHTDDGNEVRAGRPQTSKEEE